MNRRRFLSLCGVTVAGAGCQGDADDAGTVTPVPAPTSSEAPEHSQATVGVTDAAVVPGVIEPGDDSISVTTPDGQYLVLTTVVNGASLAQSDLSFRFDGTPYSPEGFRNGLYRDGEWGKRFTENGGPLVFDLPETGAADDARLGWPGGEWTPPQAVRAGLEAPLPPFDIALDGPTRVGDGDDPVLELTVTNTGEGPGRYVLALNRIGPRIAYAPAGRFDGELAAGEATTITHDAKSPYDGGGDPREVTYRLDAPGTRNDAVHRIKPADDATPTDS